MLVNGIKRVVDSERRFWRTSLPSNYLVSIGVAPRGSFGGQRLSNTFVANIDSTRRMDDVLGLFSHELTHEWIGGALRPSPSIPDGSMSWFTEGFTEFATHRVMRTAGLLSDSGIIEAINRDLLDHAISTARDSSWTAIVNGYWRDGAMQREPYVRGELIGLELNAAMLRATNGHVSLDSTLRRLTAQRDRFADGFTQETLMEQLGAQIGSAAARAIVEPFLAGGPIALSADALGGCAHPQWFSGRRGIRGSTSMHRSPPSVWCARGPAALPRRRACATACRSWESASLAGIPRGKSVSGSAPVRTPRGLRIYPPARPLRSSSGRERRAVYRDWVVNRPREIPPAGVSIAAA